MHDSLISNEQTALVEMYQRLTQQQNEMCEIILNTIDKNFQINTGALKRLTAPDQNDVQAKLSKLDIGLGKSNTKEVNKTSTPLGIIGAKRVVGIVQGNSNYTTNVGSVVKTDCYVNWDNIKHKELKEIKLVKYKEFSEIFDNMNLKSNHHLIMTPEDMTATRRKIKELDVFKVDKFRRFPSTGIFLDINLSSLQNSFLRDMFTATDGNVFFKAASNYNYSLKSKTLDQFVFEHKHGLQWTIDIINE